MISFFTSRSRKIKAFAATLAGEIAIKYPPALDKDMAKRPAENRLTRIIEDACNQAATFRAEERLGWIGRARLANEFRWQLTEKGYSKRFVEFATEAVLVYISRALKAPLQ